MCSSARASPPATRPRQCPVSPGVRDVHCRHLHVDRAVRGLQGAWGKDMGSQMTGYERGFHAREPVVHWLKSPSHVPN